MENQEHLANLADGTRTRTTAAPAAVRVAAPAIGVGAARALLGLAPSPPAKDGDLSVSVASSADSADVAGGRAGSRPKVASSSKRDGNARMMAPGQGPMDGVHQHLHPSRALWEGRATPSSPPAPLRGTANMASSSSSSRRPFASGGGREGGGRLQAGGGGIATDTVWSSVLPESSPAPSIDSSSSLGHHWSWLQRQQQEQQQQRVQSRRSVVVNQPIVAYGLEPPSRYDQQLAAVAAGGIDRPALRGQEYRRQKKRRDQQPVAAAAAGKHPNKTNRPTSSLMRSGSEFDGQSQQFGPEKDAAPTRRFLGIPLPFLPGARQGHADTAGSGDEPDSCGGGVQGSSGLRQGGDRGEFSVPEDDRRLQVSLEGTQELGKGLGGHTVYRIQVTDSALGEQWMVLRRFRQFEELHRGLLPVLSREPDANAYALPPKEVFGGRHGGVIAKRLKLLKVYLDRLVACSAAVEHRTMSSFLELDPALRGLGAYGRQHGPECVFKEGPLRVKVWKGSHKPVINLLEAGLRLIGWTSAYAIVSPGPVFLVYYGPEDDPENPVWVLPARRTIGSQVRVRRVDMWKADLDKEGIRLFLVIWENTSLLCQVDSEASLDSWAHALDESVDLRPQQSEEDRAKVDIELKAKEAWTTREEGLWGGL